MNSMYADIFIWGMEAFMAGTIAQFLGTMGLALVKRIGGAV